MGQAFDRDGMLLGEMEAATKREVFDALNAKFKDAAEIRIRSLDDQGKNFRTMAGAESEMPRYLCHKEVWALQIKSIEETGPEGACTITPMDTKYAPFFVDGAYVRKHDPKVGGYYVYYQDDYKSFSPKEAFEGGYTRVTP